jgi:prepilin-type N-terminal cleavage/methylation domain-containing protein
MYSRISNEKAFTLIELIATLVLVGIIAAVAGMGVVKIAEGYMFAKLNAETSQKAQIATARIAKELGTASAISAITPTGTTSITYTRPESAGSATILTNTINFSGGAVSVNVNGAGARTLIDNVAVFSLAAFDAAGGSTITPANIRRIDFDLTITAAGNTSYFNNNTVYLKEF